MDDSEGLRAWLLQSASVPPTRVDELLGVLHDQQISTVRELAIFSRTAAFDAVFAGLAAFDSREKAMAALNIRGALAGALGGPLATLDSAAPPMIARARTRPRLRHLFECCNPKCCAHRDEPETMHDGSVQVQARPSHLPLALAEHSVPASLPLLNSLPFILSSPRAGRREKTSTSRVGLDVGLLITR